MESGIHHYNTGRQLARHIVMSLAFWYNGLEILSARLDPAFSTNPCFMFYAVATGSREMVFTWTDDQGGVATQTARIEVS